jgi:hypothetical protein
MKAKLRVMLKKLPSFQNASLNDGSITVIATGITMTAIVTQKAWLLSSRCQIPKLGRAIAVSVAI